MYSPLGTFRPMLRVTVTAKRMLLLLVAIWPHQCPHDGQTRMGARAATIGPVPARFNHPCFGLLVLAHPHQGHHVRLPRFLRMLAECVRDTRSKLLGLQRVRVLPRDPQLGVVRLLACIGSEIPQIGTGSSPQGLP